MKDTEYIVAKAIRDGGIEAEIDHEHGWITSRATPNTYSTNEPQLAFHRRVAFCMDLHNEVRPMAQPLKNGVLAPSRSPSCPIVGLPFVFEPWYGHNCSPQLTLHCSACLSDV